MKYIIRAIEKQEIPQLQDFLYDAIFQRPHEERLPRSIILQPEIAVYITDFGERRGDECLVAEADGQLVGAVWTRILSGEDRGFGNVDAETPEFALSVKVDYRKQGIARSLMDGMLALLRNQGYKKASLAVQKDNFALDLYRKVGFQIVDENSEEFIMVVGL